MHVVSGRSLDRDRNYVPNAAAAATAAAAAAAAASASAASRARHRGVMDRTRWENTGKWLPTTISFHCRPDPTPFPSSRRIMPTTHVPGIRCEHTRALELRRVCCVYRHKLGSFVPCRGNAIPCSQSVHLDKAVADSLARCIRCVRRV